MNEANFEFNPEKKYTDKVEALADILGKAPEEFFAEIKDALGPRARRKAFFLHEAMHRLPEGVNMDKTYDVGEEKLGLTDLLSYLFDEHNQEEN
ncbi:hypothetical protein C0580_00660 [Candidatus Parcubacteria bacterium]|nr:MAG: hypothetical protein C0580_00660 [Candidatus Parcubacteria bacterium]